MLRQQPCEKNWREPDWQAWVLCIGRSKKRIFERARRDVTEIKIVWDSIDSKTEAPNG
jgi:hypothetical protein